nr:MAG TPA: hypothetical protein [Caudoviricetes sp.]
MLSTRHRRQALASRQCLSCGIVKVFSVPFDSSIIL